MIRMIVLFAIVALCCSGQAIAVSDPEIVDHDAIVMDHGGGHLMDFDGAMVMGQNVDTLPLSCKRIRDEVEITVRAGRKYAADFPGTVYGFDNHEWRVKPCTKITFHFINEDNVRHQFMMHGLPKYIYKSGMFHMEVTGPGKISGTIIMPANDETYLVHCDISQHMEKGMKGQLVVGSGGVPLPSIPGVTAYAFPDSYELEKGLSIVTANTASTSPNTGNVSPVAPAQSGSPVEAGKPSASSSLISGMLVIGLAFGLLGAPLLAKKFEGMSKQEIYQYLADGTVTFFNVSMKLVMDLWQFLSVQIRKATAKS